MAGAETVSAVGEVRADAAIAAGRRPRSLWSDAWYQFRRHRLAMGGVVVLGFLILATVAGPFLWPIPYSQVDYSSSLLGPSATHPFGTDDLGHDLFARALWGGRVSIAVGIVAVLIAITLGTFIGSIAGFFGGRIDILISRVIEVFLAVPQLPLLLVVVYLYRGALVKAAGPTVGVFLMIVGVIGALNWMPTARLVRAGFITQREREYVEAARCLGAGPLRLMRQMLPNTLSPIIVAGTLSVGSSMIAESTLSFLGLGFPPDVPTWGRLLFDAQNFLTMAPTLALFPGLMIFLAVLSINFIGDGLRDALDPRRTL